MTAGLHVVVFKFVFIARAVMPRASCPPVPPSGMPSRTSSSASSTDPDQESGTPCGTPSQTTSTARPAHDQESVHRLAETNWTIERGGRDQENDGHKVPARRHKRRLQGHLHMQANYVGNDIHRCKLNMIGWNGKRLHVSVESIRDGFFCQVPLIWILKKKCQQCDPKPDLKSSELDQWTLYRPSSSPQPSPLTAANTLAALIVKSSCNEGDTKKEEREQLRHQYKPPPPQPPSGDLRCLFGLEGLWLRYATLQNVLPSFPRIAPGWRTWGQLSDKRTDPNGCNKTFKLTFCTLNLLLVLQFNSIKK